MPKVCVGNLTNSVTGSDLLANFSRAGEVLGRPAATDKGIISAAVSASSMARIRRRCNHSRPMYRISPQAEIMQWQ
jgi:hypothetical protein